MGDTVGENTFVRPSLEYASTVWDPHTQANINIVESIQRMSCQIRHQQLRPQSQCYNTATRPQLAHPTIQTPTSQTHHDVSHYLPSITYLIPSKSGTRGHNIRYLQPSPQSASISILLLPQHHQTLEQPTTDPSQLRLH